MSASGSAVVLGGTGFVGRHICAALQQRGFDVVAVARSYPEVEPAGRFLALDLALFPPQRLALELEAIKPEVIVNTVGSIWGRTDEQMWDAAAAPTLRLLEALTLLTVPPRLIHLGSVLEYGESAAGTTVSSATTARPTSAYGRAKLAATEAVLGRTRSGELDGLVLRIANLAGPGSPEVSLLGQVASRLLTAQQRPAVVELDPLHAHRDYVDVRDVADAVAMAAVSDLTGEIIDIGRGATVPVRTLVDLLLDCSGIPAVVVERPGAGIRHSTENWLQVETGPAATRLGWQAGRTLRASVQAFWDEFSHRHHHRQRTPNGDTRMTTYVWDYLPEYETERADLLDAVDTVFRSGRLVLGPSVEGFESEFAGYHGTAHCAGVDNGTNAVKLALQALGVGPGDEVVTVSNTAAPTVLAIDGTGATPVFVDIREDDFLMDVDQVAAALTPRTKALLPVHLYGQCVDMAPLRRLADEHGLALVEDCAQAHGARHHGRIAGTMGDAAAFSFYPTKVLGAYGDGGAVITDNTGVDAALRRLRYYGMEKTYYVVQTPGHNSRLDEVQAEILRRKLGRLDDYVARRREVARRYEEGLGDLRRHGLLLPSTNPGNEHVYYVYVVRHPERDKIIERLQSYDIVLNISYPWPVHTMTGFAHLGYGPGSLPVTERLAGEIFSLPMYSSLPLDLQDKVMYALREVVLSL